MDKQSKSGIAVLLFYLFLLVLGFINKYLPRFYAIFYFFSGFIDLVIIATILSVLLGIGLADTNDDLDYNPFAAVFGALFILFGIVNVAFRYSYIKPFGIYNIILIFLVGLSFLIISLLPKDRHFFSGFSFSHRAPQPSFLGTPTAESGFAHGDMIYSQDKINTSPSIVIKADSKTQKKTNVKNQNNIEESINKLQSLDYKGTVEGSQELRKICSATPKKLYPFLSRIVGHIDSNNERVSENISTIFYEISRLHDADYGPYIADIVQALDSKYLATRKLAANTIMEISGYSQGILKRYVEKLFDEIKESDKNPGVEITDYLCNAIYNVWLFDRNAVFDYVEKLSSLTYKNQLLNYILMQYKKEPHSKDKKLSQSIDGEKTSQKKAKTKHSSKNANTSSQPDIDNLLKVSEEKTEDTSQKVANSAVEEPKPSSKYEEIDLSDTNTGIVGISGAGKTVLISLVDLFMNENSRSMGIKHKILMGIKPISDAEKLIYLGQFPPGTQETSREKIVISFERVKDGKNSCCVITDLPGEVVMGQKMSDTIEDTAEFTQTLKDNNLDFLLTCKNLIFVIPSKHYSEELDWLNTNSTKKFNPQVTTFNYKSFFQTLMQARAEHQRANNKKVLGFLHKAKPTKVLVDISQWDIVLHKNQDLTPVGFLEKHLKVFCNALYQEREAGNIELEVIGTGVESKEIQVGENISYVPNIKENGLLEYINISSLVDWMVENGD